MRRLRVGVVAGGLAAVVGCTDPGPPQRQLAQPVDGNDPQTQPAVTPKVVKPAQSDPAAEAVIAKLLAAHTGGKPELLGQLKTNRVKRTGRMEEGGQATDATMTVYAAWPDRYRVEFRLKLLADVPFTMVQRPEGAWQFNPAQGWDAPRPLTPAMAPVMVADVLAEWMTLLVPLADPAARVAAPAPDDKVEDKPAKAVRVWLADRPWMHLLIDEKTGLLTQVRYEVPEYGGMIPKSLTLFDHKPTGGVLLPARVEYAANNRPKAKWAASEVEFPKDIPADKFEKP